MRFRWDPSIVGLFPILLIPRSATYSTALYCMADKPERIYGGGGSVKKIWCKESLLSCRGLIEEAPREIYKHVHLIRSILYMYIHDIELTYLQESFNGFKIHSAPKSTCKHVWTSVNKCDRVYLLLNQSPKCRLIWRILGMHMAVLFFQPSTHFPETLRSFFLTAIQGHILVSWLRRF